MDKAWKICAHCGVSNPPGVTRCRMCGRELETLGQTPSATRAYVGYEYTSKQHFLGYPLIHIAQSYDPVRNRWRVAKGWIAVGNVAVGALAFGGVSAGIFAFGGVSLGMVAFGGGAAGILALGGFALGLAAAGGGVAISFGLAVGGLALGRYVVSGEGINPAMRELIAKSTLLLDR